MDLLTPEWMVPVSGPGEKALEFQCRKTQGLVFSFLLFK